jgi:hypothetical protein
VRRRVIPIIVLLGAVAASAAVLVGQATRDPSRAVQARPRPAGQPSPGIRPPLDTGPAPDLNLVFTAQVKGWIEPCG